ncbi:rod shape-determining protein MreC [Hypericibacter sp.]|uniref:rod shape-determining protein MreC n=1 Tax=Hypericibacter sp. TaxID=2705401 RepID=UPI003D6DA2BC
MKQRTGSALRLASPLRALVHRLTLVMVMAAAIGVMVLGRANGPMVSQARTAVSDAVAPILGALSEPVSFAEGLFANLEELVDLRAENARLRIERQRLAEWQTIAQRLDAENRQLRTMLHFVPDPRSSFISARVIGDHTGAFVREVLIAAGEKSGLRKGQAAMTGDGLAGRVSEVGTRSARVLLLTDINSRVPVVVERTRDRAILAGDNSNRPQLIYLKPGLAIEVGDRVVTSGDGGAFPPGLPVGVIDRISDGVVSVTPFVDWDHMEFLQIVDYGLDGVLSDDPVAAAANAGASPSAGTPVVAPPRGP